MRRRLPASMPGPVRELVHWLDAAHVPPLAPELVPGADPDELRRLAALGGLVAALVPDPPDGWPLPIVAWIAGAPALPASLAGPVLRLLDGEQGFEVLATLYESAVSAINRRRLGTFFTPPELTRYMLGAAENVMQHQPAHIVDPGAGVGAFTAAAHAYWPRAALTAVDVNTVTLGLLAALMHRDARPDDEPVAFSHDDYVGWLASHWPELPGPRLILGNPPYTRHQQMSAKDKKAARDACGGLITSGLAGLSAYFLAASLLALRDDDALCLLLPGSWCETRYGREIRAWLWNDKQRAVALHMFPSRLAVFPGTQVTAMVLTVGPTHAHPQPFEVTEADIADNRVVTGRTVRPDRTGPCPPTFARLLSSARRGEKEGEALGVHARIRRGVATGASDYFFLTDQQREEATLPHAALRAALVKPGHLHDDDLTLAAHSALGKSGKPRWLLDLNGHGTLVRTDSHLREYLHQGIARRLHLRHLTSQRPVWYTVERVLPPDLFIGPVGKLSHRVIVNSVGAVSSNNLYGVYLNDQAPWTATELAGWLRSTDGQDALRHLAREYQGGSLKIEPRSLRGLVVPKGAGRGPSQAPPAAPLRRGAASSRVEGRPARTSA